MARHKSVAISTDDLLPRVEAQGTHADEVMCRDDVRGEGKGKWWVVKWPEHVTVPAFNGDASYGRPMTEAEARELADCVYGERD
jgi:hypothetical protein